MEQNFNVNRSFNIFCDKLTSNNVGKDLIIESSYNSIDFCGNSLIFDGEVYFDRVICNNITISNISEISTKFLRVNSMTLPTDVKILYNSVNDGYIINTRVGINSGGIIGRSDAYFTYINVSGGDSSFNNSVYINKNLRVDGILTISNNLLISGNNFASIDNSFNIYKYALEQSFFSNKISTTDVSALKISISNELYVNKTAYINDLTISGQLLNNVLKVPSIFIIDPSGYNNHSGTLNINGDLIVKGATTSFSSSIVDICDDVISLASNLVNISDLSNTNAGLDISNIASLKYNGTNWNFSGGHLAVQNKLVMLDVSFIDTANSFGLNLNALNSDFSSTFFTYKSKLDNSYNATYSRSQVDNSFILKSNFDSSLTSLNSYVDNSYILVNTFDISFRAIRTLMDSSYIAKSRVGNPNSFDISFNLLNANVDLSYVLKSVFEASHNSFKSRLDNSFATINPSIIGGSFITIETINTSHYTQRFGNNLWNQIGQNLSFATTNALFGISNNGRVVGLTEPAFNSNIGRLYVYEISFNGTSYSWQTLGLSSEIMVGQTTTDSFGGQGNSGLAFSSDGRIVAISAILNDTSGNNTGQIRVFELSSNIWRLRGQPINGKPLADYRLGFNVALSGNGNILAAASRIYNEILAYEFSGNSWIRMGQDISGSTYTDQSGYGALGGYVLGWACALSLDGSTIIAGQGAMNNGSIFYAGRVNIYRYNNTTRLWDNIGLINGIYNRQYFGWQVSISSNGNTIAVGSRYSNGVSNPPILQDSGSIIVYTYNGGTSWTQIGQTIFGTAINETIGGVWVNMSNDGTIISFSTNLRIRVFKLYANTWIQLGQSINRIWDFPGGQLLACVLSGDGTTFIHQQFFSNSNNRCTVYGMDKLLSFTPSTSANITTTISGGLIVGGRAYLKSLNISNRHIFDGSINGYSSHYLASTDISASIVDYYSNVGYTYNRVFRIDACGNITNYSGLYGAISDSRLKENIINCTPKLEDLLKVRVVNYNLKGGDTSKYIGVVAQELEEIFPELVTETNSVERFKSVNYSNLTILLIKAFQEQQVLINNLNASLEELENEILKHKT
jgi:hypothetical protein